MNYIQLYAKIYDIYPTEHWQLKLPVNPDDLVDPAERILYSTDGDCIKAFQKDIQQNGINFQLKLHPFGLIGDGNCRYWGLRKSWEITRNANHLYAPIDLPYFLGLNVEKDELIIRKDFLNDPHTVYTKRKVIKSKNSFPNIDLESLHRGNNPYTRITNQATFKEIK